MSHLTDSFDASRLDVLSITLIPSGISSDSISFFAFTLSSPSILLEIPPVDGFFGSNTRYFPARLR